MQKKKKLNLDIDFVPFTIKSKWITDLKVIYKTVKLLKDNIGEKTNDPEYDNNSLDTTPMARFISN